MPWVPWLCKYNKQRRHFHRYQTCELLLTKSSVSILCQVKSQSHPKVSRMSGHDEASFAKRCWCWSVLPNYVVSKCEATSSGKYESTSHEKSVQVVVQVRALVRHFDIERSPLPVSLVKSLVSCHDEFNKPYFPWGFRFQDFTCLSWEPEFQRYLFKSLASPRKCPTAISVLVFIKYTVQVMVEHGGNLRPALNKFKCRRTSQFFNFETILD